MGFCLWFPGKSFFHLYIRSDIDSHKPYCEVRACSFLRFMYGIGKRDEQRDRNLKVIEKKNT